MRARNAPAYAAPPRVCRSEIFLVDTTAAHREIMRPSAIGSTGAIV